MAAIGEWVIDEACRATATWPEPITVALNISPKQMIQAACPISSVKPSLATSCRGTGSSSK